MNFARQLLSDERYAQLIARMLDGGVDGYSPDAMPQAKDETRRNAELVLAVLAEDRLVFDMSALRGWTDLDSYQIQSALRHLQKCGLVEFVRDMRRYRCHFLIRSHVAYTGDAQRGFYMDVPRGEAELKMIERVVGRRLAPDEMHRFLGDAYEGARRLTPIKFDEEGANG